MSTKLFHSWMPGGWHKVALVGIALLSNVVTGCGNEKLSFCDTAREFQRSIQQVDAVEIATSLGPEFWAGIDQLLEDLAASEPETVGPVATELRSELALFVERLEAADYNAITAALDPQSAEQFFLIAAGLIAFAADELQSQVDANC